MPLPTNSWSYQILEGPLSSALASYVSAGDDVTVLSILNEKTIDVVRDVDRRTFVNWCAATGMRAVIQDVSADTESPLRSSALAMLDIILGGGNEGINFADPSNVTMLDAWVYYNKLTTPNRTALLALATKQISQAELIMGRDATLQDVAAIRGEP